MQKEKYFINDIIALCPMTTDSSIRNWVRKDMAEQQGNKDYVLASPTKEHTREKWTFTLAGVEYMLKKHVAALDQSVFDAIDDLKKGKDFDEVVQQINAKNETLTVEEARKLIREEFDKLEQNNQTVIDPTQLQNTINQAVKREIQTLNPNGSVDTQLVKDVDELKRQVNVLSKVYQQSIEQSQDSIQDSKSENNRVVDAVMVDGNEWQKLKQEVADMRDKTDLQTDQMKLITHDEPVDVKSNHTDEVSTPLDKDNDNDKPQRRAGNEPAFDDNAASHGILNWKKMWLPVILIIAGVLLLLKVVLQGGL